MQKFRFGSKTFLLGEYLALLGGPSVIAVTKPYFEMVAKPSTNLQLNSIHPESPAGQWLLQQKNNRFSFEFIDPHQGQGGFGASSAQFIGAVKTLYPDWAINTIWQEYKAITKTDHGYSPSGADIIAQAMGPGINIIKTKPFAINQLSWPFDNMRYEFIRTQKKLATHEHLKTKINIDAPQLKNITEQGIQALNHSDADLFITAINDYHQALLAASCVAKHTQQQLAALCSQADYLAAKGCGAMGADVILSLTT